MSDPETILLPRSRVVLRQNERGDAWELIGDPRFLVKRFTQGGVTTYGWGAPGKLDFAWPTIDEAASRLDAHIMTPRAALLPADARERIVAVLNTTTRTEEAADAILRALRGEVTT